MTLRRRPKPDPHGACRDRLRLEELSHATAVRELDKVREQYDAERAARSRAEAALHDAAQQLKAMGNERDGARAEVERLTSLVKQWEFAHDQWCTETAALRKRAEAAEAARDAHRCPHELTQSLAPMYRWQRDLLAALVGAVVDQCQA